MERRVTAMIEAFAGGRGGAGYIANVGNGLLPSTPVEGVAAMVDAVHRWRPAGARTIRLGTRKSALALVQVSMALVLVLVVLVLVLVMLPLPSLLLLLTPPSLLVQARWVARKIITRYPDVFVELVLIAAVGDKTLTQVRMTLLLVLLLVLLQLLVLTSL